MNYRQILPPEALREYVRYYWVLENQAPGNGPASFRTIADGSPGIVFQRAGQGPLFREEKQLPPVFLYGQGTRHSEIHSPGSFTAIGIYFQPNALQVIFGLEADGLTDSCLDLNELAAERGIRLQEQLLLAGSEEKQLAILSAFLLAEIRKRDAKIDKLTEYAVSQIILSSGNISIAELRESVRLSERSFERRFKQSVGISPKLFSRICRFQASLAQMRNKDYSKLSDLAFEHDYADQSHHIRAFKEFAGVSPFQFSKKLDEVVENFPQMIR